MTEPSPPAAKTSSRTIIVFILLCPCVLILTAVAFWASLQMEFKGKLAKLRAQGVPTTHEELAAYYAIPDGEPDATEAWLRAIQASKIMLAAEAAKTLPIVGTSEIPVPPPGEDWSQLNDVRQYLSDHSAQLKIIHEAAQTPGAVRFPVDFSGGSSLTPIDVGSMRGVARILHLDASIQAHDENDQKALKDLQGILLCSEALRDEPNFESQLVRCSLFTVGCRTLESVLPSSDWTEGELKPLRDQIAKCEYETGMRRAVNGELVFSLESMDRFFPEPIRLPSKLAVLDSDAVVREHIDKAFPDYQAVDHRCEERMRSRWIYRITPGPILLGLKRISVPIDAKVRAIARQRAIVAFIDAQRFRLQEGRLPVSLEQLEAAFPSTTLEKAELRIDPFGGAPLKLISNENGIIIYSIGEDGIDDGGHIPRDEKERDIGFMLPR